MSKLYVIKDIATAKAYLKHSILGTRLKEISGALLELEIDDIEGVFNYPDHLKLHSCMTLLSLLTK